MKILDITSRQAKRIIRATLSEKLPIFMGKITTSGGRTHPLAEDLFSVILVLYKGQDYSICSEKRMLQACSDLLNNSICEWESEKNFVRFAEIPEEILREAIWRMPERIETAEDLRLHLLPTHLKESVKAVCGGSYSQAMFLAFQRIESRLPRGEVPLVVWNSALSIPTDIRKHNLGLTTTKELTPCAIPISSTLTVPLGARNHATIL